jgi:hypothetical protein
MEEERKKRIKEVRNERNESELMNERRDKTAVVTS